jgi:hypothetical protein
VLSSEHTITDFDPYRFQEVDRYLNDRLVMDAIQKLVVTTTRIGRGRLPTVVASVRGTTSPTAGSSQFEWNSVDDDGWEFVLEASERLVAGNALLTK